jgi:hypothetical protein
MRPMIQPSQRVLSHDWEYVPRCRMVMGRPTAERSTLYNAEHWQELHCSKVTHTPSTLLIVHRQD